MVDPSLSARKSPSPPLWPKLYLLLQSRTMALAQPESAGPRQVQAPSGHGLPLFKFQVVLFARTDRI